MPRTKKKETNTTKPTEKHTLSTEQKTPAEQPAAKPLYFCPSQYISYSALTCFESCSYEFYVKYFLGVRFPETEAMRGGTIFQNALNAKYSGADPSPILDALPTKEQATARKLLAQATDFDDIVSIDTPYEADFGLGIPVKFIPDLLTKTKCIENKYSSGYYNATMAKKQMQGTLYYHGVYMVLGYAPEVSYQIFNKRNGKAELVKLEKTQKDVDNLITWMDELLQGIKKCYDTGDWVPKSHGRFPCSLGDACPSKY